MASWDEAPTPESLLAQAAKPPKPTWDTAPVVSPPKNAETFWEHVQGAIQGTGTSMLLTQKLPEFQSDPATTPWYVRNAANAAAMIADVPLMAAGALAGIGTRSPIAAGAGMMVAPAVVREAMTDYLQGKQLNYWELLKTAGKEAIIGGATFAAGGQVAKMLPGASELMTSIANRTGRMSYLTARSTAIAGAEVGAMVGSRGALEWRVPEAHEWVDAAVLIGGMRGVHAGVSKLQTVWSKTGVPPERVAEDTRADPQIRLDMLNEEMPIPRAYEHLIEPRTDPIIDPPPRIEPADPRIVNEVKTQVSAAEKAATALEKAEAEALAKAKVEETRPGEAVEEAPRMPTDKDRTLTVEEVRQATELVGDDVFAAKVQSAIEKRDITDPLEIAMTVEAVARDINAKAPEGGAPPKGPPKPPPEGPPKGPLFDGADPKTLELFEYPLGDVRADGVLPVGSKGKGLNTSYIEDADAAVAVLARQIKIREAEMEAAQGGTRSLETMRAEAEAWLRDNYGNRAVMDRMDPERRVSTAEILARRDVLITGAEEVWRLAREGHAQLAKQIPLTPEQAATFKVAEEQLRLYATAFFGVKAESGRIQRVLQEQTTAFKRAKMVAETLAKHEGRSPEEAKAGESAETVRKGTEKLKEKEAAVAAVEEAAKGGTTADDAAAARTAADVAKKARKSRDPKKLTEDELKAKEAELAKKKEEAAIKAKVNELKRLNAQEKELAKLREQLKTTTDVDAQMALIAEYADRHKMVEKAFKGTEKETELQQVIEDKKADIQKLRGVMNEETPLPVRQEALRGLIADKGLTEVLSLFNQLRQGWEAKDKAAAKAEKQNRGDARAILKVKAQTEELAALQARIRGAATPEERRAVLMEAMREDGAIARMLRDPGIDRQALQVLEDAKGTLANLRKAMNTEVPKAERNAAFRKLIDEEGLTDTVLLFNRLRQGWEQASKDTVSRQGVADAKRIEKLKAQEADLTDLRARLEAAPDAEARARILMDRMRKDDTLQRVLKGPDIERQAQQVAEDAAARVQELRRSLGENVPKAERDAALRTLLEEEGLTETVATFNKLYGQTGRDRPTAADARDVVAIRRLTKEREQLADLRDQLAAAPDEASRSAILDAYAQSKESLTRTLLAAGKETERGTIASTLRQEVAELKAALKEQTTQAERDAAIMREIQRQGGMKSVENLMLLVAQHPEQAARIMKPPTTTGKWLEAWKAGLVSGPMTYGINIVGNTAYGATRMPVSLVKATAGLFRTGEDRVLFQELVGEAYGMMAGLKSGLMSAGKVMRYGDAAVFEHSTAAEGFAHTPQIGRGYIPYVNAGEIIRLPFRILSASDLVFRSMNEGATMYAEAYRRAINREGLNGNIHEAALKYLKDEDILAHAKASGKKYTFTTDLGPTGQAVQRFLRDVPAFQFLMPFIRTPTNIFKETGKFVPAVNMLMREQRAEWAKGGEARDAIVAQQVVGGALAFLFWTLADQETGVITGAGDPDPQKRAAQIAAGYKPYTIHGVDYSQIAVVGTLMSVSADLNIVYKYMTRGERDHALRMLAFAAVQQVTNKNFVQGGVKFAGLVANPYEKTENFIEQLAASFIPGISAQPSAQFDGYVREIDGVLDAIKNRIYWTRQGLWPKNDMWGERIKMDEPLWGFMPLRVNDITKRDDPVRREFARLGMAAPIIPKSIDAVPGALEGRFKLSPEERDTFGVGSGRYAYMEMHSLINSPDWEKMNDFERKKMFERAFKNSREFMRKTIIDPHLEEEGEKALLKLDADLSVPGIPKRK